MSGCGHEGPWSNLVTYAPTIHALSGLTYLSNPPGRGDVGPGFSLNDHAAGLSAAFSILAALEARTHTGAGQHVDISQMETGAYLIGPALIDYLIQAVVLVALALVLIYGVATGPGDGGWEAAVFFISSFLLPPSPHRSPA